MLNVSLRVFTTLTIQWCPPLSARFDSSRLGGTSMRLTSFSASKYRIIPYIVSCTKLEDIGLMSRYASLCPVTTKRSARFLEHQLVLSSLLPYHVYLNLSDDFGVNLFEDVIRMLTQVFLFFEPLDPMPLFVIFKLSGAQA